MPLGTRQDFFPRQTDRQTPFRELSQARDCTEPPNRRFRSRVCSLADPPPPPSANKEQCLRICEREISHSRALAGDLARLAADYFRNRFMLSKSMMPRQLNSRSIPRIALILVLPCCNAKLGNAATPNFTGGTLKSPILRSSTCPALIFRAMPLVKCAEARVGCKAIPSEFTKASLKVVIKAPVSTSRRAGCP